MACYRPEPKWESCVVTGRGKRPLTNNPANARKGAPLIMTPCHHCEGCLADKAAQWSLRAQHEASMHKQNAFVTLTYAPENNPGALVKPDIQKFFKRLRYNTDLKFRYLYCGEWGEHGFGHHPHFHVLFFGQDFRDPWSRGTKKFTSQAIEKAWGKGIVDCGDVEEGSCNYVCRYALKKLVKDHAGFDFISDYSRNPGLAAEWIDRYHDDIRRVGYIPKGNSRMPIPPYYFKRQPDALASVKEANAQFAASKLIDVDIAAYELRLHGKQLNAGARRDLYSRSVL